MPIQLVRVGTEQKRKLPQSNLPVELRFYWEMWQQINGAKLEAGCEMVNIESFCRCLNMTGGEILKANRYLRVIDDALAEVRIANRER